MEHKKLNRIIAGIVFIISLTILAITTQSSIPFWDCGESTAAAYLLQVPHPPGSPTHSLIGRIVLMFPFFDIAFRLNFLSALAGALSVMLIYLSSVILITSFRGKPKNLNDKLIMYGSSVIGALAFSFSDTFWFIAVESTHFSLSLFLLILVFWIALHWSQIYEKVETNEKYFLLIGYLFGLAIGVHQLSLLAFFSVALVYYFRKYEVSLKSFILFWIISALAFVFVYKGVFTGLPNMLGSSDNRIITLLIAFAVLYGIYYSYKHKRGVINFALLTIVFIVLGYSTYTLIVIRANKGLAMNENNPDSFDKLIPYLSREQYGDWPIINFDKQKYDGKLFPRRWSEEGYRVARFKNYKSDWDYFVKYQFYNMWLRYLLWNYVGRGGDVQDAPPAFIGKTDPKWLIGRPGTLPDRYYAIPLIIGMIGAFYHFWRDKKLGFTVWTLFIITGFGLMFYQNMQDPQPRERDYFFVGSFYVFALWISIGIVGILEMIGKIGDQLKDKKVIFIGVLAIIFIAVPGSMLFQNYDNHNRNGNYLAWDISYNLLQSCPKDAILITVGDNDTFPIWYLQDAVGVRRDVRLVNMSLINTDWYPLQMKNETPYGAKKVPFTYSDADILRITHQFNEMEKEKTISLPVSKEAYKKFLENENKIPKDYRSLINLKDQDITDSTKYPNDITFKFKSYYSVPDQNGRTHFGTRAQDLFVLDMVKANNWERPICFSITAGSDAKIGLDEYLKMEGMIYRLTPFKLNTQGEFINAKLTYEQLTKEPQEPSNEPQVGFRFRNLNSPSLYLDENAMRMAQDYRSLFFNLATYFINYTKDSAKALEVLNVMQAKLPASTIRFDYRMKYNLFLMYYELKRKPEMDKTASEIEKDCLEEIERDPMNVSTAYNPYRILLDVYEMWPSYDKEIDLLNKLTVIFPDDKSLKDKIEQVRALKNKPK